ncbi:MAG: purine-nucleoside phosphorylase [Ignavibacteriales bacterium]|nr:purine-nucleoside phosphorylase [Ignavibacteriales bacterium]
MDGRSFQESVDFIRSRYQHRPAVALILGSGLGDFAETLKTESIIQAAEIPYYPVSTVQGHAGRLVFGQIIRGRKSSQRLLVFQGRVHFYESGILDSVVYPVLLAHKLGARVLLVTNAAGGINSRFRAGDLMLLRDVLSFAFLPPSRSIRKSGRSGATRSRIDGRTFTRSFVSGGGYFDLRLQRIIRSAARKVSLSLQEGTYCWLRGPTYETAAEIRMLGILGADAVGMSTVPEIITAKRLGMRVAAISLISNLATGISHQKLSHEEVTETGNQVKESFSNLLQEVLFRL